MDIPLRPLGLRKAGQSSTWDSQFTRGYDRLDSADDGKAHVVHDHEPGWKSTVMVGGAVIGLAMIANIVILTWASHLPQIGLHPGDNTITLFQGACSQGTTIKTWSHLTINVVSTLILVASGACMQCLSAPTREEVDRAHMKGAFLDIGVLSTRNLFRISKVRLLLWTVLSITSIPLHLIYNSVIFSTISANDSLAVTLAPGFRSHTGWNATYNQQFLYNIAIDGNRQISDYVFIGAIFINDSSAGTFEDFARVNDSLSVLDFFHNPPFTDAYDNLTTEECANYYATDLISTRSNVALITSQPNTTVSLYDVAFTPATSYNYWAQPDRGTPDIRNVMCNTSHGFLNMGSQDLCKTRTNPVPDGFYVVDYCLAQKTAEICAIGIAPSLMIVVIVAGAMKLATILTTVYLLDFNPLITQGDAIISFMRRPDDATVGAGPLSHTALVKPDKASQDSRTHNLTPWKNSKRRWFAAASKKRWTIVMFM